MEIFRIKKNARHNGEIEYIIEKNIKVFGLIVGKWHTIDKSYYDGHSGEFAFKRPRTFETKEEALNFLGINPSPIVKTEIINIKNY